MSQWRQVPTYLQDLITGTATSSSWYRWFQDMDGGKPPSAPVAVALTTSPMTYTATQGGFLIVDGGTVTNIKFFRGVPYTTGVTQGCIPLSSGDACIITYTGTPALTFVPQ